MYVKMPSIYFRWAFIAYFFRWHIKNYFQSISIFGWWTSCNFLFHKNTGPNSVVILFLTLVESYNVLHKGV